MTCVRVGDLGLPLLLTNWPFGEINTSGPRPMPFVNEINPFRKKAVETEVSSDLYTTS